MQLNTEEMGQGDGLNAVVDNHQQEHTTGHPVHKCLSQKLVVPPEPVVWKGQMTLRRAANVGLTTGRERAMHKVEVDVKYGKNVGWKRRALLMAMSKEGNDLHWPTKYDDD